MNDDPLQPMNQLSAHLDRGWDLVVRGDLAGAMVSAEKSIELDEDSPEAYNLLGYIYAAQGRAEDALEQYKQALELDESFVEAMLNAGEVLVYPLHQYEDALALVDEALEWSMADEERAEALFLKLAILLAMGREGEAATLASTLPREPLGEPRVDLRLGQVYFDLGQPELAEAFIESVLAHELPHADAYYYAALIAERKGQPREAAAAFLQTREADMAMPLPPWSVSQEQFERWVQAALQEISGELAELLDGALVVVSDVPGREVVAEGLDPRVFAHFYGAPEGYTAAPYVEHLFVYQRNIERVSAGLLEVQQQVRVVIEGELRAYAQLRQAAAKHANDEESD